MIDLPPAIIFQITLEKLPGEGEGRDLRVCLPSRSGQCSTGETQESFGAGSLALLPPASSLLFFPMPASAPGKVLYLGLTGTFK